MIEFTPDGIAALRALIDKLIVDPVPALERRCDESLYGPATVVTSEYRAKTLADLETENRWFICHKATLQGRAAARAGYVAAHPELQALEHMGLIYLLRDLKAPGFIHGDEKSSRA